MKIIPLTQRVNYALRIAKIYELGRFSFAYKHATAWIPITRESFRYEKKYKGV